MNHSIPKETFTFFNKLAKNNDRDWFNEHKPEFKAIETKIKASYNYLGELMSSHDQIEKTKIFRIYRDVRFSKNKLPYKTHFGGSFARRKPDLRGGYYLHIQPNNESFIATGFWEPNKEDLFRIRKEIEVLAKDIRYIKKSAKKFYKLSEKINTFINFYLYLLISLLLPLITFILSTAFSKKRADVSGMRKRKTFMRMLRVMWLMLVRPTTFYQYTTTYTITPTNVKDSQTTPPSKSQVPQNSAT